MKTITDFVEKERRSVSELARLSCDPALTFRPDPTFRARFRNPDEILESDFNYLEARSYHVSMLPAAWTCSTRWRRSPKD
jgi:hypothetical protein